jgi:NitT/TauT family transport system substrate-binding protein
MMRTLTRRNFLAAGAGVAALGALAACGNQNQTSGASAGSGNALNATIGYNGDGNGAMLEAVAQHQDLWSKHGINATTKVFTNGPLQIQALGTGDLDFGYIGPGALWLPMQGKAKIVAVEALGTSDRVIAKPGINSIQDLKGKSVGVPDGTSGDMLLGLALKKAGMTVSDIKRVTMDPPTVISAFTSGQIDAAGIWYPFVDTIRKRVPNLVEVAKSSDFPDLAFPACLVAGPNITQKHDLLKRFQAVAKDAMDWSAANKSQLPDILAPFLKAPKDSIQSEMDFVQVLKPADVIAKFDDGAALKWFQNLNQQFIDMKKIDKQVDPKDYILIQEYKNA